MLWPRITISPTSPCGDLVVVLVDDLHLDPFDRGADRARLALHAGVVGAGDRRGLREAVALEHDRAEGLFEAAQDLDRHRGAAGDAVAQRGGVEALALGVVEQRPVHRRHAVEVGDAVALHRLQRLAGVEFRHQGEAGADLQRGVHATVWPKEWKSGRAPRTTSPASISQVVRRGDVGVAGEVEVGQLGALRLAGRARGVEDHRGVVLGGLGQARRRLERSPAVAAKAAGSTSISSAPASAAPSRASSAEAVPGEQQLGAGVLEVEGDLAPLQQHVHRHDDRRPRAARRSRRSGTRARWAASPRPGRPARRPSRAAASPGGRCARRARRS